MGVKERTTGPDEKTMDAEERTMDVEDHDSQEQTPEPAPNWPSDSLNAAVLACLERLAAADKKPAMRRVSGLAVQRMRAHPHPIYVLSEVRSVHGIGKSMFTRIQENLKHLEPAPSTGPHATSSSPHTLTRIPPAHKINNADIVKFLSDLARVTDGSYDEEIRVATKTVEAYPHRITVRRATRGEPRLSWWVSVRIREFFNGDPIPTRYLTRAVNSAEQDTSAGVGFPASTPSGPTKPRSSKVVRAGARSNASKDEVRVPSKTPPRGSSRAYRPPVSQPAMSMANANLAAEAELTPEASSEDVQPVKSGTKRVVKSRKKQRVRVASRATRAGHGAERTVVPADVDHVEHGVMLAKRLQSCGAVASPAAKRRTSHGGHASSRDAPTAKRARKTRGEDVSGDTSPPSGRILAHDAHVSGSTAGTRAAREGSSPTQAAPHEDVPECGSAAYALLVGLFDGPGRRVPKMEIEELVNAASPHMVGPTTLWSSAPGTGMRTVAGNSMASLIRDGLVARTSKPLRFHLTAAGLAVAHRIAPLTPAAVATAPEQNPGPVLVSPRYANETDDSSVCKTEIPLISARTTTTPPLMTDGPAPMVANTNDGLYPSHVSDEASPAKPALSVPSSSPVVAAEELDASTPSTFETKNRKRGCSGDEAPLIIPLISPGASSVPVAPDRPSPTHSSTGLTPSQTARGAPSPSLSQSVGALVPLVSAAPQTLMAQNSKREDSVVEAGVETSRKGLPMSPAQAVPYQPNPTQISDELALPRTARTAPSAPSIATAVPLATAGPPNSPMRKQKRSSSAVEISSGTPLVSPPGSSGPKSRYQPCPTRSSSQLTYARGMGLVLVAEGLPRTRVKAAIDALLQADAGLCMDADAFCARVRALVAAPPLPSVDLDDPAAEARAAAAIAAATAKLDAPR